MPPIRVRFGRSCRDLRSVGVTRGEEFCMKFADSGIRAQRPGDRSQNQSIGDPIMLGVEPLTGAGGLSLGVGIRSSSGRKGRQRSVRQRPPVGSMASAHPSPRSAPRSCGALFRSRGVPGRHARQWGRSIGLDDCLRPGRADRLGGIQSSGWTRPHSQTPLAWIKAMHEYQ